MSDDKTPIEHAVDQAVDAFVYAPIGLLFDGPAMFPTLVQKGKSQVQVAKMMGQMAVQMGQAEVAKRAKATDGPVREVLQAFGVVEPAAAPAPAAPATPTAPEPSAPAPAAAAEAPATKAPAKKAPAKKTAAKKAAARKAPSPAAAASKAVAALGIADYDSLSASQVVSRLRGLLPAELDAVRQYEAANRARKTILNKVVQLQKD